MSFSDTYAEEVLQSRRLRSQRAGFWAKVVGLLLMLTIGAALRSEPQLRQALMSTGIDAVMSLTGRATATAPSAPAYPVDPEQLRQMMTKVQADATPTPVEVRPEGQIRVNRFSHAKGEGPRFQSARPRPISDPAATQHQIGDTELQTITDQLGRQLQNLHSIGN